MGGQHVRARLRSSSSLVVMSRIGLVYVHQTVQSVNSEERSPEAGQGSSAPDTACRASTTAKLLMCQESMNSQDQQGASLSLLWQQDWCMGGASQHAVEQKNRGLV
ncbi:hypothetical protein JOB18_003958 [Solea senegalensis]|uniref:Uncharacterized protein n=1 Tax=Solea senegalensis TaxID=28829 RepID=A0AAV6RIY7_SOLSE|nr:hypothetical protein JOB18_003958 [Solea senegalensis]